MSPRHVRAAAIAAAVIVLAGASALLITRSAEAATANLAPIKLTTTAGEVGRDQRVTNLWVRDLSGRSDGWNRYVEFIGRYDGFLTFVVPTDSAASAVTALRVELNYRGPAPATQPWTFSLYHWPSSSWVTVGTNIAAPDWGDWKMLTFDAPGRPPDYVSAGGELRFRLSAGNRTDAADIDYLALILTLSDSGPAPDQSSPPPTSPDATSTTAPPTTTATKAPPTTTTAWPPPPSGSVNPPRPNARFDYQIGGAYLPPAGVEVVSRDREAEPAAGLYNICYVNAFQTQPHEESFWEASSRVHLITFADGNRRYDGDWGEFAFDISTDRKRHDLAAIVNAWITKCKNDGFNAIEPDNLDTYTRFGGIDQADATAYAKLLIDHAHSVGLAIAQKNTAELDGRVLGFDFAVAEECGRYNECGDYMTIYGSNVIVIEYRDGDFTTACNTWGSQLSIVRRDVNVTPRGPYQSC